MTSILTDWGKRCIEKLTKGVIAEARFVFCFTCIAKEFEEERARLEPERETLRQRVKVAKRRNKDVPANVVSWEEEVDKLIQEDTKTKKTCFFGLCPDCIWRYKKGKKMANNMEDIKQLMEKVDKFVNVELPRPPPGVERNSSQDYISLKGRELTYIELREALKDDNNFITGLQGMGGTGKTTLAKEVGKKLKESGQFTYVIDTTVSFTPDIKKIQDDIAGPLGLKWEGCNESDRPKTLWDRLTNGDKILLILDDVWDQEPLLDFDAIGIPKRDNHKGCRVLVTTRSKLLSNKMNFNKSIELELLSDEDVWTMFKWYAEIGESSSKNVMNKGSEIAKECKQLPVAIAIIARSLKGQQNRVEKWDATLTSLKKHVPTNGVEADVVGIYKCLKVSYDNMKDTKAKELFLLCSLFREDEEISIEVLTRIGIGAGLFGKDCGTYDEARKEVVVSKYDLVDSCLLLEVDEKHVKMHDLVRDMAQRIASKEVRVVNLSKKKSLVEWDVNIRYSSFEGKKIDLFSCKFDGSKLKTLIVNIERDEDCVCRGPCSCLEVPNSFFENTVGLQVLHFSSNVLRQISLPKSFQLLANIRSLLVDSVDLGDISVLEKLQSLEAVDLVKCKIHDLPIEIRKLENLKLLRLESCEIGKGNPFEVIKKCSSLEELCFIDSFNDSCLEITLPANLKISTCSTLISVFDLTSSQSLLQLETLEIGYCAQLENIFTYDGDNDNNKSCNSMFPNLEVLYIYRCDQLQFILPRHSAGDLLSLECIIINGCDRLKYIFGQHQDVQLASLKRLVLEDLPNFIDIFPESNHSMPSSNTRSSNSISKKETQLKQTKSNIFSWSHICCRRYKFSISLVSDGQPKDFSISLEREKCLSRLSHIICNTKEITLVNLSKTKSVFVLSTSRMMLESLTIENCDELKHIIVDIGVSSGSDNTVFPNLKELKVKNCGKLEYIFGHIDDSNDHQNHNLHLPALKCLKLSSLPSLTGVCTKNYRTTFPPLAELELGECTQVDIKSIGDFIVKELSGNVKHFAALERLKVDNSKVESICCLNEGSEREVNLGLQNIELYTLPMLTRLFKGLNKSFSLKNLTTMKIKGCEKLEFVFSTSIIMCLPQLLHIKIEECKELKHMIEDNLENKNSSNFMATKTVCFPKLRILLVVQCNQLKDVFPISLCKEFPELEALMIKDADKLEEIFVCEKGDEKVNIPNLKFVAFVNLPSLCQTQGIHFQAVRCHSVQHCKNFSLTSAPREDIGNYVGYFYGQPEWRGYMDIYYIIEKSQEETRDRDTCNESPSSKTTEDIAAENEVQVASPHILPSSQLEGSSSTSENPVAESLSTIPGTKNGPPIQVIDTKQKGIETVVEEETTSTNAKTITHLELELMGEESMDETSMMNPRDSVGEIDATIKPSQGVKEVGDGKIRIPSFSIVNTEPPPTKDVDIGDSQKTIAMEDINKLIEEDPLLALEKLLAGQVSIFSIRILLQELKSLMDSSSDLHHLISNQESKSKLICLFNQLNQHQGLLPSHVKEFIEKVQTFFIDNFIKYATFQQVLKKHNQLLDSKTDLVNKLWSAYSTQTRIDHEISTANARIDELSFQTDEHRKELEDIKNQREALKSVVNRCNVQKNKLKAECTEWAQQSKELNSALASSEVDVREAERARNLATEGFANLKSSFPTI